MSRFTTVIIATIAFALLAGCGPKGLQKTSISGEPEWYRKPPVNKDFMYGAYSATSQDMQLACDKAAAGARADIGKQVEVKIQGMEKRFNEETGIGNDAQLLQQFTQATKVIVNATLQNTIIKEKITRRDGDNWRAYVLIEYPVADANASMLKELKKNEVLLTRLRSSEAFKELENDVAKDQPKK